MGYQATNNTKYIPRGLAVQEDGEFVYSESVGVRLTPNDEVATLELTQDYTDSNGEVIVQAITLSPSQIVALVEVLDQVILAGQD